MPAPIPNLDLLRLTACDLQTLLTNGTITSRQLLQQCLHYIEKNDRQGPTLRAMISIVKEEKLYKWADELDQERKAGKVRGPLHGIPTTLKDLYDMGPEWNLPTTEGAWAMAKSFPKKNGAVAEKLLEAGMIIIGKSNMSEFGAAKGPGKFMGESALGGVVQSPYIVGGANFNDEYFGDSAPGGSSSGAGVGVVAGYCPFAIGTEATGSIQTPASRLALYGMRCTPGSISASGDLSGGTTFNAIGILGKCAEDIENATRLMLSAITIPRELTVNHERLWKDMKIGFVDPRLWELPCPPAVYCVTPNEQYRADVWKAYSSAMDTMKSHGATVHYPVTLPSTKEMFYEDILLYLFVGGYEFRSQIDQYLQNLESSDVRSLADIIQFNKDHPELQAGIEQDWLVDLQHNSTSQEDFDEAKALGIKLAGTEGAFKIMDELDLDAVVSCADGDICLLAALAGSPTGTVPLGSLSNETRRPFGLTFMARPGKESTLVEIMRAYEKTFPARRVPTLVET